MQYALPTTKNEMIETLKDIFYYYRIRREGFEEITLDDLSLTEMTYVTPTAEEIRVKAVKLVAPSQKLRELNYKKAISEEVAVLTARRTAISGETEALLDKINQEHSKSIVAVQEEAVKKGIAHGSIVIDKIAELEAKKSALIIKVNEEQQDKYDALSAEITAKQAIIANATNYFSDLCEAEIQAKICELYEKEEEVYREVFKYNNSIAERELKYSNAMKIKSASLHLQYMEIVSDFYTKDELVEMGYYTDAINCVTAYYDTLPAYDAYTDIVADRALPIYLDDYYSNLVYLYKTLAGR